MTVSAITQNTLNTAFASRGVGTEVAKMLDGPSNAVAAATYTIGAAVANVRSITVQLVDYAGANVAGVRNVTLGVYADSAGAGYATTGGSTGIAATTGIVTAITAKKLFTALTDATGKLVLNWTDTASEEVFLGVTLPTCGLAMSASVKN